MWQVWLHSPKTIHAQWQNYTKCYLWCTNSITEKEKLLTRKNIQVSVLVFIFICQRMRVRQRRWRRDLIYFLLTSKNTQMVTLTYNDMTIKLFHINIKHRSHADIVMTNEVSYWPHTLVTADSHHRHVESQHVLEMHRRLSHHDANMNGHLQNHSQCTITTFTTTTLVLQHYDKAVQQTNAELYQFRYNNVKDLSHLHSL